MQHLLSRESVDNRVGVVDQLVLITGGPSSDMRRTLDAATTARQDRLQLVVVGLSPWVNQVLLLLLLLQVVVGGSRCLQCFDAVGWAAGRASGL